MDHIFHKTEKASANDEFKKKNSLRNNKLYKNIVRIKNEMKVNKY